MGQLGLELLHLGYENFLVFEPFLKDARLFLLTSQFVFEQPLWLVVPDVAGTVLGLE